MMGAFEAGQRVRIKPDAFPGSLEACDVWARGRVGTLMFLMETADNGEQLWWWRGDDGTETAPISSELDAADA